MASQTQTIWNYLFSQIRITASSGCLPRLDNLGKGASGAAVQNMNIALGLDEMMGLSTGV